MEQQNDTTVEVVSYPKDKIQLLFKDSEFYVIYKEMC